MKVDVHPQVDVHNLQDSGSNQSVTKGSRSGSETHSNISRSNSRDMSLGSVNLKAMTDIGASALKK
jgi:hypothetical protein